MDLRVVAAAVLSDRGLLLVSKHASPAVHYLPGGKPELGEAPLDCLAREVREELNCRLVRPRFFAEVQAPAALEDADMHMTVFLAGLRGTPAAASEIASIAWWPAKRVALALAVRLRVIPELQRRGFLDATVSPWSSPDLASETARP